jgi:hypothetical protein
MERWNNGRMEKWNTGRMGVKRLLFRYPIFHYSFFFLFSAVNIENEREIWQKYD